MLPDITKVMLEHKRFIELIKYCNPNVRIVTVKTLLYTMDGLPFETNLF